MQITIVFLVQQDYLIIVPYLVDQELTLGVWVQVNVMMEIIRITMVAIKIVMLKMVGFVQLHLQLSVLKFVEMEQIQEIMVAMMEILLILMVVQQHVLLKLHSILVLEEVQIDLTIVKKYVEMVEIITIGHVMMEIQLMMMAALLTVKLKMHIIATEVCLEMLMYV